MTDVAVTDKPLAVPTENDAVLGVTADGLVKLFAISSMPASGATAGELDAAKTEAITTAVAQANAHADAGDTAGDAATLTAAEAYADAGDAATLSSANAYADTVAAGGGVAQTYVDSQDAATLSSANSHADSAASAAQSAAQSYADSGDATTLSAAQTYADGVAVGGSYTPGGTGAVSRTMVTKVKEVEVSVLDYGADPTGASDSTTAFNNAIATGAYNVHIPAGTYKISNLVVNKYVRLYGDGRSRTIIRVTTTSAHGMDILPDPDYVQGGAKNNAGKSFNNTTRLERFALDYIGTGMADNKAGLCLRSKVIADAIYVRGFTHSGIITDTWSGDSFSPDGSVNPGDVVRVPFFMELRNVQSKDNGEYGFDMRFGSNANLIVNCDFSDNGIDGFWHHPTNGLTGTAFQPAATYGTTIIGGQCSYNGRYGWNLQGSGLNAIGIYAEGNTDPMDVVVDCSKSNISLGIIRSPATSHCLIVDPNDRTTNVVSGGTRLNAVCNGVSQLASTATLTQTIAKVNQLMTELATRKILASST